MMIIRLLNRTMRTALLACVAGLVSSDQQPATEQKNRKRSGDGRKASPAQPRWLRYRRHDLTPHLHDVFRARLFSDHIPKGFVIGISGGMRRILIQPSQESVAVSPADRVRAEACEPICRRFVDRLFPNPHPSAPL